MSPPALAFPNVPPGLCTQTKPTFYIYIYVYTHSHTEINPCIRANIVGPRRLRRDFFYLKKR